MCNSNYCSSNDKEGSNTYELNTVTLYYMIIYPKYFVWNKPHSVSLYSVGEGHNLKVAIFHHRE